MTRIGFLLPLDSQWMGGLTYTETLISAYLEALSWQPGTPSGLFVIAASETPPAHFATLIGSGAVTYVPCAALSRLRSPAALSHLAVAGRWDPVFQTLKKLRLDAVFSPALWLGWRPGVRVITWLPDFQHRALPHLFSNGHRWGREISYRLCAAHSARVIASGGDVATELAAFPAWARPNAVRIVPFCPKLQLHDAAELRRRLQRLGITGPFFYLPNQFWAHKNHALALSAVERLRRNGWTGQLVLSGADHRLRATDRAAGLRDRIAALETVQAVRFVGQIPHGDVVALMQACQSVLNPSRHEGRSSTVEEALYIGAPLVLSDIPAHRAQAGSHAGSLARFHGTDDADGLARLLASAPSAPCRLRPSPAANARRAAFVAALGGLFGAPASAA